MSEPLDELEVNSFYKFLQTNLRGTFEKSQEACHIICIPLSQSLANVSFTKRFAEYHILKPSPYFQGQYLTLHALEKTVTLENDTLTTTEGFPAHESIRIISEELAYNKNYKPYRILVIERPLDPSIQKPVFHKAVQSEDVATKYTFKECKELLWSHSECKSILVMLDDDLDKFNRNYMVLKDYLRDTSSHLQSICSATLKKCVKASEKLQTDARFVEIFNIAIESYVTGKVHKKVFPVIRDKLAVDDRSLKDKLNQLRSLSGPELGLKPQFTCPLPRAMEEMMRVDGLVTPYERLQCVRHTLDYIKDDVAAYQRVNNALGAPSQGEMLFTSDDLIPILVSILAQCQTLSLASNLFYMEHFSWSLTPKDELSFCLATLKASVEYVRSVNINKLRVKYSTMDAEDDGNDRLSDISGKSLKYHGESESELATSPGSALKHIERQLDKMARMLDTSSRSLSNNLHRHSGSSIFDENRHVAPQRTNSQGLGDFLTDLDEIGPSFSKQP